VHLQLYPYATFFDNSAVACILTHSVKIDFLA